MDLNTLCLSRHPLRVIAIAILAGCGSQVAPTDSVIPTGAASATHGKSWMLPEAKTIKKLLYISGGLYSVAVYNYETGAEVGTLQGFNRPAGQCVDSKGDVFITNDASIDASVVEYAHGGTAPLQTLSTGAYSVGCSVDPTTGNLAVANLIAHDILIFKNASGTPTIYKADYHCAKTLLSLAYDDKGNLYMEAWHGQSNRVCELPHGGAKIEAPIKARGVRLGHFGSVMWDGKYITLAEEKDTSPTVAIYQMKEDASGALTKVGQTVLDTNCDEPSFTLFIGGTKNTPDNHTQGKAVVGTNTECGSPTVFYWAYPSGGNPTMEFTGATEEGGESVSIAP